MYGMDQFENELKELRIVLSDVQKQQFEEYYKLLVEWNEVMNLTAITDYKDVMKKHFFDSLTVVRAYPEIKRRMFPSSISEPAQGFREFR